MVMDQPQSSSERLGDEVRMTFGEHLEELRTRLILALIGVGAAALLTLFFGREIISWLLDPLMEALARADYPPQAYFRHPTGAFTIYIKVGLVGGLVLASPWVIYQFWKFISAGMYRHERKVIYAITPFSGLMTVLGIAFTYYVLLPLTLWFLIFFSLGFPTPRAAMDSAGGLLNWTGRIRESVGLEDSSRSTPSPSSSAQPGRADGSPRPEASPSPPLPRLPIRSAPPSHPSNGDYWIQLPQQELRVFYGGQTHRLALEKKRSVLQPLIGIGEYIGFVVIMALSIAAAFQMPVVMLVLGWTGLVAPGWVVGYRKYCVFGCFVIGAVASPGGDPITMLVLSLPLWLLFELGLLMMRLTYHEPGGQSGPT